MRKILLLIFFVWGASHCFAQNDYYWSSGKKNYLTIDSSTVIVQTAAPGLLNEAVARLRSAARTDITVKNIDSLHVALKYRGKAVLADVVKNLPANAVKAGGAVYARSFGQSPFTLTGTIVYQLKAGKTTADVLSLLGEEKVVAQHTDKYKVAYLTPERLDRVLPLANKIYESGLVKWCHPDFLSNFKLDVNDPLYSNQYYLKNTGQGGGTFGVDINMEPAWNAATYSSLTRVAVIDNGVEAHDELGARLVTGFSAGITGGTGAPISNVAGHGEACAGIIGASKDNFTGVAGINSFCNIVPVNIFTNGTDPTLSFDNAIATSDANIAAAINWAWDAAGGNADVLSCSWGRGANFTSDVMTQAITDARTFGRGGRGTVVVFAAGNSGNGAFCSYPGNVPGVISVGSITKNGAWWGYSNNSPSLVAPSGDVNLNGDLYTIDRMGSNGYNSGNYMGNFGGTSAACPQVAGVASLIISLAPYLTEAQVTNAILSNAVPMGNTFAFGAGRLNAAAAIQNGVPVIAGPASFCTATATYSVANAPAGATITWASTSPGTLSIPASGNPVTATRLQTGYATVLAYVNGIQLQPKQVTIGSAASISAVQSGACHDGKMTWLLEATPTSSVATNWQWIVDNPGSGTYYISNPNSPYTSVTVQGGGYVSVSYTDACGLTSMYSGALVYSPCPSSFASSVSVYPNPVSDQLLIKNIAAANTVNAQAKAGTVRTDHTTASFEARLYNNKGQVILTSKNKDNGDTITMDTKRLPDGNYYLVVLQGVEKVERQIVIRH